MAKFGIDDWLSGTKQADGSYALATQGVDANGNSVASGSTFARTTVTLSAGQAAGTTLVLAANATRRALYVTPSADCILTFGSGDTAGITLIGGLSNDVNSPCPVNALYLSGLATGAVVTFVEG